MDIALRHHCRTLIAAILLTTAASVLGATGPDGPPSGCTRFAELQARYGQRFVAPMIRWSRADLADLKGRAVLYPFSGPDVVTALSMFPDAPHLTLVADQTVEFEGVGAPNAAIPGAAERECRMLSFFAQLGYYRTHDLNGLGGARPRFLQLLRYSIAFAGAAVDRTRPLGLTATGTVAVLEDGSTVTPQGVRFEARRQDGRAVLIDYLTIDLSNRGLKTDPAGREFLHRNASDVLFLKSASHLLQHGGFSELAALLTTPAGAFVVQDETGLPVGLLERHYELTLYGRYSAPQALWARDAGANAFANLYATHDSRGALPYVVGYEKKAGSALMVGRRR